MVGRDRLSNAACRHRENRRSAPKFLPIVSWLIAFCVFPWAGCSRQMPLPDRAELIQALGPIDDSAVILGGSTQRSASRTIESKLAGKLWLVKSMNPLPQRFPVSDVVLHPQPESRSDAKALPSKGTFPVRAAYDIAAALKVDARELELPMGGSAEAVQGRLTEWKAGNSRIRIRDFQTLNGWLSVVELFIDPL